MGRPVAAHGQSMLHPQAARRSSLEVVQASVSALKLALPKSPMWPAKVLSLILAGLEVARGWPRNWPMGEPWALTARHGLSLTHMHDSSLSYGKFMG